jgi:hypothetical protein
MVCSHPLSEGLEPTVSDNEVAVEKELPGGRHSWPTIGKPTVERLRKGHPIGVRADQEVIEGDESRWTNSRRASPAWMLCDGGKPALLGQEDELAIEEFAHRREIARRKQSRKAIF